MNILTYCEIMDGGASVFHCVAREDEGSLLVTFSGVVRVDNPARHLSELLADLRQILPGRAIERTVIDFTELEFCNSNGFYSIMDVIELVYATVQGPVLVRRLEEDDWQQETLPILLNLDEPTVAARTSFEDVREI
jgi:hypothetical protein